MHHLRTLLAVVTVLAGCVPMVASAAAPTIQPNAFLYERSSDEFASAIIIDVRSGKALYQYQPDRPWSAASLTKMMGALVFMDHKPSWNRIVSIQKDDQIGGGSLRVSPGATLSVRDLLFSSITASANNAAVALPRTVGLSKTVFVKQMNAKATKLGMTKSSFVDPSGLDPKNMSTARDIATLALAAFNVPEIKRAATTASYTFSIRNTGVGHTIRSTNDLLTASAYDNLFVTGGKTGFLYESRYNLAVRLRPTADNDTHRELMVVVLGSPTRTDSFKTANSLANWAWRAYQWQ